MIEPPFTGPVRKIEFVECQPNGSGDFYGTLILIDGVPFQNLIDLCFQQIESSLDESHRRRTNFSKRVAGFSSGRLKHPDIFTVADPVPDFTPSGVRSALAFVCYGCGEGCCDTHVAVRYTEKHVHWYNVRYGSQKIRLELFGILTFDREQYKEQCARLRTIATERERQELTQQLVELEQSHLIAENRRDPEIMDSILHPEFLEIGASGEAYTKEQVIAALMIGDQPHFEIRDFDASYVVPEEWNSRIWHAHYVLHATYPDETTRLTRRTSIWVPGRGRMQLRFHQGTPIVGDR
jgi:hypothetical protein